MGWLFCSNTRQALVKHLTQPETNGPWRRDTLKSCSKGYGLLWGVFRTTNTDTQAESVFIACFLLRKSDGMWGYKDMEESMHPYQYSCPLSYLALAPEVCPAWRKGVQEYHEQSKKRRDLRRSIRNHNKRMKESTIMKNECGKMRPQNNPYEIWQSFDGTWTWYVLKKWQVNDDKPYARWFCNVVTPICPYGEMGDCYVKDIQAQARRIA